MSTRRKFTKEFKDEAVAFVRSSGLSVTRAAEDLGVSQSTLNRWVRQAEVDDGDREGLTTEERQELARLKRENRILKEEREILKKAAAWFARESETR